MKILLLNGSPKPGKSASEAILLALKDRLGTATAPVVTHAIQCDKDRLLEQAKGCEALVLIFPLYVDGLPSHLLRLLEDVRMELRAVAPDARVYAVVNNGFFEAKQTRLAIQMVRHFSDAAGLAWGRGLGIGAGGMIRSARIGHGPMKRPGQALDALAQDIRDRASGDPQYAEPNFPRSLYKTIAHIGWRLMAKKNGVSRKQLSAQQ